MTQNTVQRTYQQDWMKWAVEEVEGHLLELNMYDQDRERDFVQICLGQTGGGGGEEDQVRPDNWRGEAGGWLEAAPLLTSLSPSLRPWSDRGRPLCVSLLSQQPGPADHQGSRGTSGQADSHLCWAQMYQNTGGDARD